MVDNSDDKVISDFGSEWNRFKFLDFEEKGLKEQFANYSSVLDFSEFDSKDSIAADFGAGSGRWSYFLLPHFKNVYLLEPSQEAYLVCKEKYTKYSKAIILNESIEKNSILDNSLDLAMSLGVMHHMPDTQKAIKQVARKLKVGGRLFCYLYYKTDDKPIFYKMLFLGSDLARKFISKLPFSIKLFLSGVIALFVYWPLAKITKLFRKLNFDTSNFPLHHYAELSFTFMYNDALDRFGTKLEKRFSKEEIVTMLEKCDFDISTLKFSETEPCWTFTVKKSRNLK